MSIEIKISKRLIPYTLAYKFLQKRVDSLKRGKGRGLIWILEHPISYTSGVRGVKEDVLDKNIKIIKTNRGGKITLHSPGQKIVYFAINISKKKDIRKFVNKIENCIIKLLKKYRIKGNNDKKNIGVWVKGKKIAAIGIRVSRWIAFHGCSINLNNNLKLYAKINPCGLDSKNITTVEKEIGFVPKNFEKELIKIFKKDFSYY